MKTVIAIAISTIATVQFAAAQVGTTTGGPLTVAGTPVYGIAENGNLFWYFHQGAQTGAAQWANQGQRIKVGEGWNEGLMVFKGSASGNEGVVYRVDSRGDLYWYRHNGHATGSASWQSGRKIGNGWQSARVAFAAGNGEIYVIDRNDDLLWYRHLGYLDGREAWANQATGAKVGVGWGQIRAAFAAGDGVIYAIDRNGDLFWYRHTGHLNGTFSWANDAKAIKVGNGWNEVVSVFAGGDGVIYAMKRDGNLYWYKHAGLSAGTPTWAAGTGSRIGTGWAEMVRIF